MDTTEHFHHYEKLSRAMNLPLLDGLPGFGFNPTKVLRNLIVVADDIIDDKFTRDIIFIIKNYFTYGRAMFKLLFRKPRSLHKRRLRALLHHYRIVPSTECNLGRKRAITIQQLIMSVPQLVVKLFVFGFHLNHLVDQNTLRMLQLTHVSPACFVHYSFSLLPRYQDDADDQFFNIIKAKLLFQFAENELALQNNDDYNRCSNEDKMSRLISRAKVIYDSSHICDNSRWFCYHTFFVKEFFTQQPYHYNEAAKLFDDTFNYPSLEIEGVFKLQTGSNKTLEMDLKDIDEIMRTSDPFGISTEEIEAMQNGFDLLRTSNNL